MAKLDFLKLKMEKNDVFEQYHIDNKTKIDLRSELQMKKMDVNVFSKFFLESHTNYFENIDMLVRRNIFG